ncbi:MAG: hypothetical protein ABR570_03670 [Burkholderiales bacterium]
MRVAFIALALLGAQAFAGEPVVTPVPSAQMRPGYGVVESVTAVRVAPERSRDSSDRSAAAGGTAPATAAKPMYRVAVRLPDGSLQYRDIEKPEFRVGDDVLLTNAGDIVPD